MIRPINYVLILPGNQTSNENLAHSMEYLGLVLFLTLCSIYKVLQFQI